MEWFWILGSLVLAGLGWYKFAYKSGVEEVAKKIREEAVADAKELSENAEKVHSEIKDMDEADKRKHHNDWS